MNKLESAPLGEAAITYFVDSSCFSDHLGNHTGYAIVQSHRDGSFSTVKAEMCPQP